MDIVFSVILVLGAIFGAFLLVNGGRKKNKGLAIVGGVVAGLCALIFVLRAYGCSAGNTDVGKLERIEQAAGKYMGMQLKGKNVMVILEDDLPPGEKKVQDMMYEAFKEGYGAAPASEYKIARLLTFGVGEEQAMENAAKYYGAFDEAYAAADSNNCDVIVHFAALPLPKGTDLRNMHVTFPSSAKILLMPVAFSLENPVARQFAEYLFEHNHLYGIVADRKGFKYKDEIPDDVAAAFEKRYLLITPENKDSYPEYLEYSITE